jgi:predicted nucleotidyltransferase
MVTDNQLQILAVLSEHPEREFYLSEVGLLIGKHPGVFQKGINALEREGWVQSRRRGNQRLFRVNPQHPLLNEIKALIQKSVGAEALLKTIVNNIPEINKALIYGSYARGTMRSGSDIDLLIVTEDLKVEDSLVRELSRIEKFLQRDVNYKLYDQNDFAHRRKIQDPFLSEVLSDKHIILKESA